MRFSALLVIALVTGCGQKGPLYFAPQEREQPSANQPSPDNADTAQQDDHKKD